MHNLADYINKLQFDHLKTYSGLRGPFFDEMNSGIEQLSAEGRGLRRQKMQVYMDDVELPNARIIHPNGQMHKSTTQVFSADRNSKFTERITEIFNVTYNSQGIAMCPPIFRDALVFYSVTKEITGILHICFGCSYIQDEAGNDMAVDDHIFPLLKKELLKIGHPIKMESNYF